MKKISYTGYRFPPEIIQQAIWLYLRFTLSFRDVEDLLAERGIAVSYETIRRWVNHFGPMIAADLRKRRPKPHTTWHLDEAYLKIDGRMVYLWRAVDAEGEVLDVLVQSRRDKHAALKLMRKLLKKYSFVPDRLITDDLRSYGAAARDLGIENRHERGRWKNNRAENSHQPTRRRERKMQRFKSPGSAVAVGTRVTPCPPRRSRRAAFPHRAPVESQTRREHHRMLPSVGFAASVTGRFRFCARGMRRRSPSLRPAAFPPRSPPPICGRLCSKLHRYYAAVRLLTPSPAASSSPDFLPRPGIDKATTGGMRSPRFRRVPFRRDVVWDSGRASAPRILAPHMLPSTFLSVSASAKLSIS